MIMKATHQGNCQVCGRLQALPGTTLSNHGYTVSEFHYFHGVCPGARRQPLQLDRAITDKVVADLRREAKAQMKLAADLRTGKRTPATAPSGKRVRADVKDSYGFIRGCWQDELVPFAAAPEQHQQRAIQLAAARAESEAVHARRYANDMERLAERIHGTDLVAITDEPKAAVVDPVVNQKSGTVTGTYATKAARNRDLDRLSRQYDAAHRQIQDAYLAGGDSIRGNAEATDIYYGPASLNNWRAKHSATARKFFPQLEPTIQLIEELAKTRLAVKSA